MRDPLDYLFVSAYHVFKYNLEMGDLHTLKSRQERRHESAPVDLSR